MVVTLATAVTMSVGVVSVGMREGGKVVDSRDDGHAGDAAGVRRGCGDGGGNASACHLHEDCHILDSLCSIWGLAYLSVNSGMSLIYMTQCKKPGGQCSSILSEKWRKD